MKLRLKIYKNNLLKKKFPGVFQAVTYGSQVVQEVLPGRHGDGDVGGRFRSAGTHVDGRMGQVRAGRDRGLVLDTAGRGGPVAQGDPVHGRVRRALSGHRRVLCAHILHRPADGAQVSGRGHGRRARAHHHDNGDGV